MTVSIRPGIRIMSRRGGGPGTLGAILRSKKPVGGSGRKTFLLSCSHVLAPFGAGGAPQVGDEIIAPEVTGAPRIGRLSAFTISSVGGKHAVDAAIAEIDGEVTPNASYALSGGVELPITGVSNAIVQGLEVFELGHTDTTLQRATVGGEVQSMPINFHGVSHMIGSVFGCARVNETFGDSGDSGAIVFNKRGRALGLQVAQYTPFNGDWAVACPIVEVLRALQTDYRQRHGDTISLEFLMTERRMALPDPSDLDALAGAGRQ